MKKVVIQSRCGYETPIGRCQRRSLGYCSRHRVPPHRRRGTLAHELYRTYDDASHRRWQMLRARRARDMMAARGYRGRFDGRMIG